MKNSELIKKAIVGKWMPIFFETIIVEPRCILCEMFHGCHECPIAKFTGLVGCHGTPYWKTNGSHDSIIEELLFLFKVYRAEKKKEAL